MTHKIDLKSHFTWASRKLRDKVGAPKTLETLRALRTLETLLACYVREIISFQMLVLTAGMLLPLVIWDVSCQLLWGPGGSRAGVPTWKTNVGGLARRWGRGVQRRPQGGEGSRRGGCVGQCGDGGGTGFTEPKGVKRGFSMNLRREPQPLLNANFSLWPWLHGYCCDVVKHRNLQCLLSLPLRFPARSPAPQALPPVFPFSFLALLQLCFPPPHHRGTAARAGLPPPGAALPPLGDMGVPLAGDPQLCC